MHIRKNQGEYEALSVTSADVSEDQISTIGLLEELGTEFRSLEQDDYCIGGVTRYPFRCHAIVDGNEYYSYGDDPKEALYAMVDTFYPNL